MKKFLVIGFALCAGEAAARMTYPPQVKTWSGAAADPSCSLCHTAMPRACANASTSFASSLKGKIMPQDKEPNGCLTVLESQTDGPKAIEAALKVIKDTPVDSDGDKCPDFDEIKGGKNPNDMNDKPANCPATPKPDAGMGGGAGGGGMAGGAGGGGSAGGAGGGTPGAGGGTPGAGGGTPSGAGGGTPSGSGGGSTVQADGGTGGNRPPDPGGCNTTGYGTLAVALGGLMLLRRRMR
jgi:hypothetical protein